MPRRTLWSFLIVMGGAGLCTSVQAQGPGATGRPNVVLVITDDAGYGDLGSYGAPDVRTPHIDRLARDGVRLTDFYANGATCTPTRAALISGRYQQRFELEAPLGVLGEKDWGRGLAPTGRSLPRLLKNNGYATALIGKWHLGWKSEFSPGVHGSTTSLDSRAGSRTITSTLGAAILQSKQTCSKTTARSRCRVT